MSDDANELTGTSRVLSRAVDHEVLIDSGSCQMRGNGKPEIQPGETRSVGVTPWCLFRAGTAGRVDGIDYAAFEVEAILVGPRGQINGRRAASVLFEHLRMNSDLDECEKNRENPHALDTCQHAVHIGMLVKNISDRPQRFAIKLRGKAIL